MTSNENNDDDILANKFNNYHKYSLREPIDKNKSHISLEYNLLKEQLNQIKNGQIQILTATISVSAILWGILYDFSISTFDLFSSLFYLIPLLIILPSSLLFFDKSLTSVKIIGLCRVLERIILGYFKIKYYIGYENNKKYLDGSNKNCPQENIGSPLEIDISNNLCKSPKKLREKLRYLFMCRINRFLCIGFLTFVFLILISYIFSFYSAYLDGFYGRDDVVTIILILYLSIYSYYTYFLLDGKLHGYEAKDWFEVSKNHILIWFLIMILPLIIVLFNIIFFNNVREDLFNISTIMPLITNIFYIGSIIILIGGIFIKIKQYYDRKSETLKINKALKFFWDKPEYKEFFLNIEFFNYIVGYVIIILLTLILSLNIIWDNVFISIMYTLTYLIIFITILLIIIFCDIAYQNDSIAVYEKNWELVIQKVNDYYLSFDIMDKYKEEISTLLNIDEV